MERRRPTPTAPRRAALGGVFLALFLAPAATPGAPPPRPPRLLLIGLDAVPYGVVAAATDPGRGEAALFRGLRGPVPLVSTFPSTTSLAFGALLEPFGVAPSPGYEVRFFDRRLNRRRGGGPITYGRLHFPWRSFFDWKIHGLFAKLLQALRPLHASRTAIDRSLAAFMESDRQVYFAYYDATDLVGHLRGPDRLTEVLAYLDRRLGQLRRAHPERPFYTVLYSDHGLSGGEPLVDVRREVRRLLHHAGYRPAAHLRSDDDVVFMPFGLVSSFVVYTAPGREAEVAKVLVGAAGVDLCAAVHEGGWWVEGKAGGAMVRRRRATDGEVLWSYEPRTGDPLALADERRALAGRSPDAASWIGDRQWFEATRWGPYPDPFHRISRGFDLVDNGASVLCSLEEGAMYGAAITVLGSRLSVGPLRWTHGSLLRQASLGFIMSDVPSWEAPEVARFDEALAPFVRFLDLE